jgi:hypothetical protein
MNESLAATLGELHAQIYWLHDAEKFAELASAAATIYMKLGYTHQQAETASNLISQAYQLADDAANAQKIGNFEQEMQLYHQAKDKLTEVETILGYQTSIAIHQMKWWMYFRHQQKFKILIHLFLQHLKKDFCKKSNASFSPIIQALSLFFWRPQTRSPQQTELMAAAQTQLQQPSWT